MSCGGRPFGVPGFGPIMTSAVQQQNLKDERMATGSRDGEPQNGQDLGSSDAPTARSPAALIEYEMYSDLMSTPEMRSTFSETSTLRAWLNTWAAMAEAQADHGVIPKEAASGSSKYPADSCYPARTG